jgi:hypothetical protein
LSKLAELLGKEKPRIFTPPLRKLTTATTQGPEFIKFAEEVVKVHLFPWQRWLAIHALELLPTGGFRFRKVFVLVGRQNGKSLFLQLLSLWRMYLDGADLILGTAQDRSVAAEQWLGAVEIAENIPELASEFGRDPVKTRGFENFTLSTGETYKIAASNRRAGRGKTVSLLLLDELREHQTWDAWSAVSKTTNARRKGQIWAVSNAGDASSIVLRHFRRLAHLALGDPDGINIDPVSGKSLAPVLPEGIEEDETADDTLGIFEWSAPPGCSIWDKNGWTQANPSLGYGDLTERAVASDAHSDPEWVFREEVLCQWSSTTSEGAFPNGAWQQGTDEDSRIADGQPVAACIDVSWDRSTAHIAFAGYRDDGKIHVEIVASRAGTDWVIPWLTSPDRKRGYLAVAWQDKGAPVGSLSQGFKDADLPVLPWVGAELTRGTGQFYDLVRKVVPEGEGEQSKGWNPPEIFHRSQPILDVPVNTAVTKPLGDAWVWDRAKSPVDAAPLVAATGAVWALLFKSDEIESAYSSGEIYV